MSTYCIITGAEISSDDKVVAVVGTDGDWWQAHSPRFREMVLMPILEKMQALQLPTGVPPGLTNGRGDMATTAVLQLETFVRQADARLVEIFSQAVCPSHSDYDRIMEYFQPRFWRRRNTLSTPVQVVEG